LAAASFRPRLPIRTITTSSEALKRPGKRDETPVPVRSNALEPGFHDERAARSLGSKAWVPRVMLRNSAAKLRRRGAQAGQRLGAQAPRRRARASARMASPSESLRRSFT
jgi:hypothetical protein